MFKSKLWVAAAAAMFCLPAIAGAVDAFDAHCADILILQLKPIQTELGITAAQRTKMNGFAAKHQAKLVELDKQVKTSKVNPQPQLQKYLDELKANILTVLTPAQTRRLREITIQRVGLASLCDQVVANRVGLSKAQTDQMRKTYAEGQKEFTTAERAGISPLLKKYQGMTPKTKEEAEKLQAQFKGEMDGLKKQMTPQLNAIQTKYKVKMAAILTPVQKKTFDGLLGKPYHV